MAWLLIGLLYEPQYPLKVTELSVHFVTFDLFDDDDDDNDGADEDKVSFDTRQLLGWLRLSVFFKMEHY